MALDACRSLENVWHSSPLLFLPPLFPASLLPRLLPLSFYCSSSSSCLISLSTCLASYSLILLLFFLILLLFHSFPHLLYLLMHLPPSPSIGHNCFLSAYLFHYPSALPFLLLFILSITFHAILLQLLLYLSS